MSTLTNTSEAVPVQVSGLGVSTDPAVDLQVTGLPESLDLAAGESSTVELELSSTAVPGETATLALTGTVESPWQQVITDDLGLAWAGQLATEPTTMTSTPSLSERVSGVLASPLVRQLGMVLLSVLLLAGGWITWLATRPRLTGALSVLRDDVVVDERVLDGRRMRLTLPDGITAELHPVKTEAERGLGISINAPQGKTAGQLQDGEDLVVGDLTFTYTTDRTRMLQLIGRE